MAETEFRAEPLELAVLFPEAETVPGPNPELAFGCFENRMNFVGWDALVWAEVLKTLDDRERQIRLGLFNPQDGRGAKCGGKQQGR